MSRMGIPKPAPSAQKAGGSDAPRPPLRNPQTTEASPGSGARHSQGWGSRPFCRARGVSQSSGNWVAPTAFWTENAYSPKDDSPDWNLPSPIRKKEGSPLQHPISTLRGLAERLETGRGRSDPRGLPAGHRPPTAAPVATAHDSRPGPCGRLSSGPRPPGLPKAAAVRVKPSPALTSGSCGRFCLSGVEI